MPKRTYGLAGLGYVPGHAALGFDLPNNASAVRESLAHELGHNLSLPHAPCGGPANPDPDYPYANAQLGASGRYIWGYNAETSTFVDPRRTDLHDMMSYCDGDTFSDYNYRKIQVHLTPADRSVQVASASVAAGPQELLLVSGQIEAGRAELTPLKSLFGEPRLPQAGPYLLRIVTAQGVVEYPFATRQLDHVVAAQHFGFTIPHPGQVFSMVIVKDGQTLMQTQARAATAASASTTTTTQTERAASAGAQLQVNEQAGVLRLNWDHARYPYLTVTHLGAQRSTLAQDLQGGSASLPVAALPAGGAYEFSLSDGLNSVRVTRSR